MTEIETIFCRHCDGELDVFGKCPGCHSKACLHVPPVGMVGTELSFICHACELPIDTTAYIMKNLELYARQSIHSESKSIQSKDVD